MSGSETVAPRAAGAAASHVGAETVEAVVRGQMSRALGGRRGILEAAAPTLTFTVTYVSTKNLTLTIVLAVSIALVLLAVRLAQRGTVQFVFNSLVGIGVGCFFVYLGSRSGGDSSHKALAYFLPGLIYNSVYAVLMMLSIAVRWPI